MITNELLFDYKKKVQNWLRKLVRMSAQNTGRYSGFVILLYARKDYEK